MSFFKNFPRVGYNLQADGLIVNITDIFRNVDVNDILADSNNSYFWHEIGDGDRPDIVSRNLYGDPRYYWTFFIINDHLKDGVLDAWPKSSAELERYLEDQYDAYSVIEFFPTTTTTTLTTSGSTEQGVTTIVLTAAPSPALAADTFIYGPGIAAGTTYVSISGTTITINTPTTEIIANGTFLTAATNILNSVNGIDLHYKHLRITVTSLYAASPLTAPLWVISKYDSSRYQLWIDRPSSFYQFKLAAGDNDSFRFVLVNEAKAESVEYKEIQDANEQWLKNNLSESCSYMLALNADVNNSNLIKSLKTQTNLLDKLNLLKFKPSKTWFTSRGAPIAFQDSAGNNVTFYRAKGPGAVAIANEISYATHEIEVNDQKRKIRVLPTGLIREFSDTYKQTLNK